jgi:CTP:molybdopterin cytidylyltransferase MocA
MIASLMHTAGVVCIVLMAGTAVWVIWSTVAPARHKILAALRGESVPPRASVESHSTAFTPLRSVEAAAEPTFSVTA